MQVNIMQVNIMQVNIMQVKIMPVTEAAHDVPEYPKSFRTSTHAPRRPHMYEERSSRNSPPSRNIFWQPDLSVRPVSAFATSCIPTCILVTEADLL